MTKTNKIFALVGGVLLVLVLSFVAMKNTVRAATIQPGSVAVNGECNSTPDCASGLTCTKSVCMPSTSSAGTTTSTTTTSTSATTNTGTGCNPNSGGTNICNPLPDSNLQDFAIRMVKYLLGIIGAVAVIMIVIAGFRMVASSGNEDAQKKAQSMITNAIVGLVIAVLAYAVIAIVTNVLKGS